MPTGPLRQPVGGRSRLTVGSGVHGVTLDSGIIAKLDVEGTFRIASPVQSVISCTVGFMNTPIFMHFKPSYFILLYLRCFLFKNILNILSVDH